MKVIGTDKNGDEIAEVSVTELDTMFKEIRNKVIDDFFNELCKVSESVRPVGWIGRYCVVTIDKAMQIAEQMKVGVENDD